MAIRNYLGRNFKNKRQRDKLSPKSRSKLMSRIRSEDTNFEKLFISELKKVGLRFQTHVGTLKGKPDVVFKTQRTCLFLDSDFWHGWNYPRWKHLLKNDFWRNKIETNRTRDLRTSRILKSKGWIVIRIWEHQIKKDMDRTFSKILKRI